MSSIAASVGGNMVMVAQGWLVLELTDSPLSLGLVWATRAAPSLFFGVLAGTVADRVDRKKLLVLSFIVRGILAAILGLLVTNEIVLLWHVLVIAFINGVTMAFTLPTQQSIAIDIVSSEGAMNAISLNGTGMRIIGIFGGTAAGFIIAFLGLDWPFYIMTISCLIGITILLQIKGVKRTAVMERQSTWKTYIEGFRLITTSQVVLVVLVLTLVCEILGFSYMVILPIFARDILQVGAVGLGTFNTAVSTGGLLGGLSLASLGDFKHKGRLYLGIFLSFGICLILFSQSSWYPVSMVLLVLLGSITAGMDAMGHTILLLNVSEEQRGRAMGIWITGIGFGPVGSIAIGAIASLLGASAAVAINGTLIIIAFSLILLLVPKIRNI